jgi:hypothetical protein
MMTITTMEDADTAPRFGRFRRHFASTVADTARGAHPAPVPEMPPSRFRMALLLLLCRIVPFLLLSLLLLAALPGCSVVSYFVAEDASFFLSLEASLVSLLLLWLLLCVAAAPHPASSLLLLLLLLHRA